HSWSARTEPRSGRPRQAPAGPPAPPRGERPAPTDGSRRSLPQSSAQPASRLPQGTPGTGDPTAMGPPWGGSARPRLRRAGSGVGQGATGRHVWGFFFHTFSQFPLVTPDRKRVFTSCSWFLPGESPEGACLRGSVPAHAAGEGGSSHRGRQAGRGAKAFRK